MTDDLLAELGRLQRYASVLRAMLADAQDEAPRQAEGTDRSGRIRATVGADGLPESFRVEAGWHRAVEPAKFGAAVLEAAQAAAGERMAAWTRTLQEQGWQAKVERLRTGDPGPVAGTVPPAFRRAETPRSLDVLAEDVLSALDNAVTTRPPAPVTGTGTAATGKVVITLSRTGLASCEVDPEWVAQQSATYLTNVLGEALRAARQALPAVPGASAGSPLNDLFSEILAVMGDPDRLRS